MTADMERLLARLREYEPFDGAAILDDVEALLDGAAPDEEDVEELAMRLRGHSMQLVQIAVANGADQTGTEASRLIQMARTLRAEEMPDDHGQAVGLLRRMACSVNDLHDHLGAHNFLRQTA
ncbi:DUF6415 family natural product biosynthesis protein [Streptomyces sp. V3I7]|uniref:DUF6415 family natural product biosynthesis protein n=1 Tax=Streptomyces sp. V3I7 TaxID=3042278 RepID=UPI00277D43D4|nr:DUF6415 family natural product biosynthesis protein [Streptomyces sp. V3I7]MDQ0988794.1 hypothetical protein [Streptomyces sp. V3I7]